MDVLNLLSGGGLIDAAANALHLPPEVADAAKIALGVATGNVLMAADGAIGLAEKLAKNPPAETEYQKPRNDRDAEANGGWAPPGDGGAKTGSRPSTTGAPPPHGGCGTPPPSAIDAARARVENLETVDRCFSTLDAAAFPIKDGLISRQELAAALKNPASSTQVKDAAKWLLEHFDELDTAAGIGARDGFIGRPDIKMGLANAKADLALLEAKSRPTPSGNTQPSHPAPAESPHCAEPPHRAEPQKGSSIQGIINDPSLSMEEKIQLILEALSDQVNDQLLRTMGKLENAQTDRAKRKDDDKEGIAKADQSINRLSLQLQKLTERLQKMNDLMSNFSAKFNEMAKVAIQNLARA